MNYKHFSVGEREKIQRMLWEKKSLRHIAEVLGRSASSVSRELKRNNPKQRKRYTPRKAHERALEKRKSRGRKDRLKNAGIRAYVVSHLKQGWSPEQISGRMRRDLGEKISHEAIYQYVYAQIHRNGNGCLRPGKEDLRIYLRRKQNRRQKHGMRKGHRILKAHGRSIEVRPKIVNDRKRVGDWEGDSVESCGHAPGVNTLVERKTGYLLMTKLRDKTTAATILAMRRMYPFPHRTVTLDNGPENRDWERMERTLGTTVYYAHAYRSSERGTNENTNGLIREYFPKRTDFRTIPEAEIARVERLLNTRPRKRLGWMTPLEAMGVALQS